MSTNRPWLKGRKNKINKRRRRRRKTRLSRELWGRLTALIDHMRLYHSEIILYTKNMKYERSEEGSGGQSVMLCFF